MTSYKVFINGGFSFDVEQGETIVQGSFRSLVKISHSCKNGRCGSCAFKVTEGDTEAFQEEFALNSLQKEEGWILTCVRTVKSDIILDANNIAFNNFSIPKTFPAKISSIFKFNKNIVIIKIRFPKNNNFKFLPGQYIDIVNNRRIGRSYSLANGFYLNNELELNIKYINNGLLSQYWFNEAVIDDLLVVKGPYGSFCLGDVIGKNIIFLATGTGIAPIKALLEQLATFKKQNLPKKITLFWGVRFESDLYWNPLELDLEIIYTSVISSIINQKSNKNKKYIQDFAIESISDINNTEIYACGSLSMIEDARSKFFQSGLNVKNFYSDAFVASSVI